MRQAFRLLVLGVLLSPLLACEGWRLERAGVAKCEKGLALLKQAESLWTAGSLPDAERHRLLATLNQAREFLRDGMSSLAEATVKTGKNYEIATYQEALKVVRMKLMELRN
jgi:hypothetical protein